jgi:flagellar motor switch protein FliG
MPDPIFDSKRGTGRTTRLMQAAVALWSIGRSVRVVVCDHLHADQVRQTLLQMMRAQDPAGARLLASMEVVPAAIHFRNAAPLEQNGYTGQQRQVLVDHAVYERSAEFRQLYNGWTRFDQEPTPPERTGE